MVTGMISDVPEELFLGDEPYAAHGSGGLGAGASVHTWRGGEALDLRSHRDDHTCAVYSFLEDDCCDSRSCVAVLKALARRPDAGVRLGSVDVLPGAQWSAACALYHLAPLLGGNQCGYFNEAYAAYVEIGGAIDRATKERVNAVLRDAGGALSELTARRVERKALLKALTTSATVTGGMPIEPRLCPEFFANGACAHAPCRFLHVRRV